MATNSILEAMRANRTQAASYIMAKTCAVPTVTGTAAANDRAAWITALKSTIGTGVGDTTTCGQIELVAVGVYRITVFWDDSRAGTDLGGTGRSLFVESEV